MKSKLIIAACMLAASLSAQKINRVVGLKIINGVTRQEPGIRLEIEGAYNGKDLFIKNSFGKKGIGFCITQVKVNGNTTVDEINSPIVKIDLAIHKLKPNENFKLIIYYRDSCEQTEPQLMNPAVIKPKDPSGNNVFVLEGKSWNQSLLVVNPRSGKNYGIKEILVNGKKVDAIESDIVEINFYKMGIHYEAKTKVEFKYDDGCEPFVINPEAINY